MVLEKLDSIVCNALTGQSLPVHFYMKFLNFGINCLRELNMDVMANVKSVRLRVNDYKAVKLPCDFLDWTKVGIEIGPLVRELPQKEKYNRLKNIEDGIAEPYRSVGYLPSGIDSEGYAYSINERGENKGGIFNYGGGYYNLAYKFLPERDEIQLDPTFSGDYLYLEYISDGLDECTCDTMVNPYAYDTIKNYIIWQYHLNSRQLIRLAPIWEKRFILSVKKLRARMSPITIHDILMVTRKNYKATIKT